MWIGNTLWLSIRKKDTASTSHLEKSMFLEALKRRNPALLRTAAALAVDRRIPPNSCVLDLDVIAANGRSIRREADELGLRLYFMLKQIGRNPVVTKALVAEGARETVSVDIACANALATHGIGLGNVGNLVQTPRIDISRIVALRPEVITVFTVEKAREVAEAARRQGFEQGLLLRVADPAKDLYLPGMDGGITLDALPRAARAIVDLEGVHIEGVTTFPVLAYSEAAEPQPTPNFATLQRAAEILRSLGVEAKQINAPGNTSCFTLPVQKRMGATHVEPGHGFLGTTPFHLRHPNLPERPAACYVTEVAHHVGDRAYVYGGGFFVDDPIWLDPDFKRQALVGTSAGALLDTHVPFLGAGAGTSGNFGGIDYYGYLDAKSDIAPVGATVVMGFRIQSFVTRANIAVVSGCEGAPHLHGIFDQSGNRLAVYD
jgi:predicted amino acid racemase